MSEHRSTAPIPGRHFPRERERDVLTKICGALHPNGAVIIGMPSLESQAYASAPSKAGHINCKTMPDLKELLEDFFHNVFMFSMNDEIVHTGYHKMAHYLFGLCAGKRLDGAAG